MFRIWPLEPFRYSDRSAKARFYFLAAEKPSTSAIQSLRDTFHVNRPTIA